MQSATLPLARCLVALALAASAGCGRAPVDADQNASRASAAAAARPLRPGCLPNHDGYLRVRLQGAIDQTIDWRDADLTCEGGPRPEHQGGRMAFAGPVQPDGHRLRLVFGMSRLHAGQGAHDLPTNVTVIVEGAARFYSTRGEERCSISELGQQPLPDAHGTQRYRVVARGFCIDPASAADGSAHLFVSRFDFAGPITFDDND